MRCVAWFVAALMAALTCSTASQARVDIRVDLSSQTMHVSSASGDYDWPISSARSGFRTPRGTFGVKSLQTMHYSRKYHNSPMPHSIFFSGGYAIHGTYATAALGRPASHGCIRIAPGNAAALFQMARAEGARISITGSSPDDGIRYARRAVPRTYAAAVRAQQRAYARQYYRQQNGYALRGGYGDPSEAIGYAPAAPGLYQWLSDPAGY